MWATADTEQLRRAELEHCRTQLGALLERLHLIAPRLPDIPEHAWRGRAREAHDIARAEAQSAVHLLLDAAAVAHRSVADEIHRGA